MQKIHKNYSLKNNTTFGVDIVAGLFSEPASVDDIAFLDSYAEERSLHTMVIGEGSNLLFTNDFDGLIIHPLIKGIELIDESESEVLIRVGAGENWDFFVAYCVSKSFYGVENLSHIPGSVGAAPVQNIGAYGVEAKDVVEFVEVYDREKKTTEILSNAACEFAYRDSVFKHGLKNKYIVCNVVFRLKKMAELMLNYGNVKEEFFKKEEQNLTSLRDTIINIRESKLPDPKKTGNGGSYFKNPVVGEEIYAAICKNFDNVPSYPAGKGMIKIPAAWLIDKAGWKGMREGDTGTWPSQPLVIVNYGKASGKEVYDFSEKIREDVLKKFGIDLEREVLVIC